MLVVPNDRSKPTETPRTRFNSLTDYFSGKTESEICDTLGGGQNARLLFDESVKKVGFVKTKEKATEGDEEADEFLSLSTVMTGHSPGWTLFERLYLFNGQLYVITCV